MENTKGILRTISQHEKLSIKVSSDGHHNLPEEVLNKLEQPHKIDYYFFVFVEYGTITYKVDMDNITLSDGQFLFVLPNQVLVLPPVIDSGFRYYKIAFDEQTLALLPQQYSFLLNPLKSQIISTEEEAKQRIKSVFQILIKLLSTDKLMREVEILLVYLNTLLVEFKNAYFKQNGSEAVVNQRLSKYIEFQIAVESHLTEQHSINSIAQKLSVTTNGLYSLVKEYSGVSPKEFITHRLILEARRKLHYSKLSVKELAYDLGFNDPEYFSRLFKKTVGKSISNYLEELQDLSGKY